MKCPKCGYNSFEYHDSCKKCSADFSSYKLTYNIAPIVLPPEVREQKANEFRSASIVNERPVQAVETHDDMFSFDLSDDIVSSSSPAPHNDDPFSFDDDILEAKPSREKAEGGGFDDLLESTAQPDDSPFASSFAASAPKSAAAAAPAATTLGEFDLENFSWDDSPVETATGSGKAADDDFDSLFGDTDENAKK